MGEIGLAGQRAQAGEFGRLELDRVVALRIRVRETCSSLLGALGGFGGFWRSVARASESDFAVAGLAMFGDVWRAFGRGRDGIIALAPPPAQTGVSPNKSST
jgi:hypothetical protein